MDNSNPTKVKFDAVKLPNLGKSSALVFLLIFGIIIVPVILRSLIIIPVGHVGILEGEGVVTPQILKPGLNLVNPFNQVSLISTRIQDIKEKIEASSKEGLKFDVEVSLQYRLNPDKVMTVYEKLGLNNNDVLISRFRSLTREITAQYPLEEMVSAKRRELAYQLQKRLEENLDSLGFVVEEALIREIVLPPDVQEAFNQKIKIQQQSEQMKFELEKTRQEAQRQRIQAQGEADARLIKAKAEMEAQKLISRGLTPAMLQLKSIEATEKIGTSPNAKIYLGLGNASQGNIIIPNFDQSSNNPPK
ncbi:SPFH domain-containing protein [Gloeothece verrucosa]|uniref:Band 7 protein n=1 Tax=Gloeothece verrucosa (strain PCC 7822) TaxID=497965 RepID=E0UKB0_GLOV7|nr:prohibitin family protein [Gloeothece verrucosa]ADN15872.1 band 7 protein [Gloeothece verrucosa PCC 7822]